MANTKNKARAHQGGLSWQSLFAGIVIGMFIMFMYLEGKVPDLDSKTDDKKPKSIEPVFTFPELLTKPKTATRPPKDNKKPTVTTPSEQKKHGQENSTYVLQAGSFKKISDADSLKAQLALLGIISNTQTVTIDDKDTWHRVQIGPITGREKVDILKKKLKQNNVDPLLILVKNKQDK